MDIATISRIKQGEALFCEGKFQDALDLFNQVLATDADNPDALNNAGLALSELGQLIDAAEHYERALISNPSHASAFFNLIDVLVEEEEVELARETFWTYHAGIPESPEKAAYEAVVLGVYGLNLEACSIDDLCSREVLQLITQRWGNADWAASIGYLEEVAGRAAESTLPILECGSGVSTLVLGLIARKRDVDVWALEHHTGWHARVQEALTAFDCTRVRLCHAPLKQTGAYAWYDVDGAEWPDAFGLVVCDGPPGATPGGRYGLLPVMRDRLAPGCIILLDDAARPGEQATLNAWRQEADLAVRRVGEERPYAVIQYSGPAPGAPVGNSDGAVASERAIPQRTRVQPAPTRDEPAVFGAPPIFIGGAGRSGTTLVRSLLNAHPNVAIGPELKITPALAQLQQHVQGFAPYLAAHFHVEADELNDMVRQLIVRPLAAYQHHSGAERIGEKTPNNVFVFSTLHQLFPASPLVHVIRDGRDVVCSLLRQDWHTPEGAPLAITHDPAQAAAYWREAVQAGQQAARSNPSLAARYLEVRYEDLVTAPETTARIIIDAVGEPWDDAVMNFHADKQDVYAELTGRISTASLRRWATDLNDEQKDIVKAEIGDLLIDLGYAENYEW